MKINAPSEDTIIIELTNKDMTELEITYDDMDYSKLETRRIISSLLDTVRIATGREIDLSHRLSIDAVPDDNGGCVLFIETDKNPPPTAPAFQTKPRLIALETTDIGLLMDFASHVDSSGLDVSELYENNGIYRLVIQNSIRAKHAASEHLLAQRNDKLTLERTRECWHLIAEKSALSLLRTGERS